MTPKEKANNLCMRFLIQTTTDIPYGINKTIAKQCALIAVDEIIQSEPLEPNDTSDWLQPADWFSEANISADKYWQEVKKEIESL